jgi:hypothetical protein
MRTIIGPAWMFYYSIKYDSLMVLETGIRIAYNYNFSVLMDGSVSDFMSSFFRLGYAVNLGKSL